MVVTFAQAAVESRFNNSWIEAGEAISVLNRPDVRIRYDELVGGSFQALEYRKGAVLGELGRIVEFINVSIIGSVILTPSLGLIIFAGAELASLIATGDAVPAAQILSGTLYMLGPVGSLYAIAAEGLATIGRNQRFISDREYSWANDAVFSGTLPPSNRILITDTIGAGNRAFTFPSLIGVTVNLGSDYENPMVSAPQIFMHELTYAWQIHNYPGEVEWVAKGFSAQLFNAPYTYGAAGQPFHEFNIEQQAQIVQDWFSKCLAAGRQLTDDAYFMYIRDNIRLGRI